MQFQFKKIQAIMYREMWDKIFFFPKFYFILFVIYYLEGARGSVVRKTLCYKLESCGF
jgi:hypothetical protein